MVNNGKISKLSISKNGNISKQAQICAEVAKEKILLVFSSNAGINLFIE